MGFQTHKQSAYLHTLNVRRIHEKTAVVICLAKIYILQLKSTDLKGKLVALQAVVRKGIFLLLEIAARSLSSGFSNCI